LDKIKRLERQKKEVIDGKKAKVEAELKKAVTIKFAEVKT
jgi:hypothetical protein